VKGLFHPQGYRASRGWGALCLLLIAVAEDQARAQSTSWTNSGSSSWFEAGNWNNGVPSGSLDAYVDNGGTPVIGSGSAATAEELWAGFSGTGSLALTGGSLDVDLNIILGENAGSSGTFSITSGTATYGQILCGYMGAGLLEISGGELNGSYAEVLGTWQGATGTANMTGGVWNANSFYIGDEGGGILNLSGGEMASDSGFVGVNLGGNSTADISGGTWNVANSFVIGNSGSGTLNLSGNGVLSVGGGSGTVILNQYAGSAGTLTIGNGTAAGDLEAAEVTGVTGGTVNFAETGSYTFAPTLSGTLSVQQTGAGQTLLTGSNSYQGTTLVSAGTLTAGNNAALGNSAVTVTGGTLLVASGVAVANPITLGGGEYDRAVNAGADLANAVNATSGFSGGQPATSAQILEGTLSAAGTLQTSFLAGSSATNDSLRISDVYRLQGTGSDVFVLQLSVTSVDTNSYLAYLDASGNWVNAVAGNTGGTSNFVLGAYNPALDFHLGYYGLDTISGSVWAVLNYNGQYAVADAVPEPAAWVLLALGLGALAGSRRRVSR